MKQCTVQAIFELQHERRKRAENPKLLSFEFELLTILTLSEFVLLRLLIIGTQVNLGLMFKLIPRERVQRNDHFFPGGPPRSSSVHP